MIRDGGSIATDEEIFADVCIIGAGPAGQTVASGLLGSGLRVVVLESGGRTVPEGGEPYTSTRSVGERYPLDVSRARGLGGSANRWDIPTPAGGPRVRLRELEDLDFEDRPGIRSPGWPFSRSELEPYYRRARDLFGLQPADPDRDVPLDDGVGERVFSFGPASTFTSTLPARLEADPDTTVLCDAVVTELHAEGPGAPVRLVSGRSSHGMRFTVRATTYVLACGGIENARMLLASRTATPGGLGNGSGHVGRWFLEHPHITSGVALADDLDLYRRREAWDLFLRDGDPVQRKYGLSRDVQKREGVLDAAYLLEPRSPRALLPLSASGSEDARALLAVRHVYRSLRAGRWTPGPANDVALAGRAAARLGTYTVRQTAALRAARAGRRPRTPLVFSIVAMAEQTPTPDSRVQLASTVDQFGVPEAELVWQVSAGDAELLHRSQDLVAPALSGRFGVRTTSLLSRDTLPGLGVGYHHMGTTRMSVRPQDGVVDPDGRVHGVRNLFVAGSSVFPTGGSANPTLTLVALATRLGDLLRRELRPTTAS